MSKVQSAEEVHDSDLYDFDYNDETFYRSVKTDRVYRFNEFDKLELYGKIGEGRFSGLNYDEEDE
jgi:hypothetical protein